MAWTVDDPASRKRRTLSLKAQYDSVRFLLADSPHISRHVSSGFAIESNRFLSALPIA